MRDILIVIVALGVFLCVILGISEIIFEAREIGWHLTSWHYTSLVIYGVVLLSLLYTKKS